MAPQTKRAASHQCKDARSPVKKTKSQAPEKTVDPLAQKIVPIVLALASWKATPASCNMLLAALPHCLAGPKEERHIFQQKMLDLTSAAVSGLEEAARARLADAEATAEIMRADSLAAQADFESGQIVANNKKDESDAKALEVENSGKEVQAAKDEVMAEMEKKEALLANKATLIEDQGAFQKVLEELWRPLKASSFLPQQWSKRNRSLSDLIEKIKVLSLEESLVEALKETVKLKVAQRGSFSQKALNCVEDAFEKHRALLAERITGTANEEAVRDAAVVDVKTKLAGLQSKLSKVDNDSMDLQNSWAELETKAAEAKNAAASFEADVQSALQGVTACQDSLQIAVCNVAAFAALCKPQATQQAAVAEEDAEEPRRCMMDIETEAVAVAA